MSIFGKIFRFLKSKMVVEKISATTIPIMEGSYLNGHIAFISGGCGGIGYAIAKRFIANGCKVIISGRDERKLKSVCNDLGEYSNYVVLDLSQPDSFCGVLMKAAEKLKDDEYIDILVNCAGNHGPSNFWDIKPEDWDEVMDINLKSMYFMCQTFGEYMREHSIKGHILNISSASALKPGKTPYEISKNAVKALTLGVSAELIKYGIVVNCLAPGPTATPMLNMNSDSYLTWNANPSKRVALPEEIANWAVFMVSSMGDYIVGDSFYITGGSGTICIDR